MFIVNPDLTISPTFAKNMVLGAKDDLILVKRGSPHTLVFNAIQPSAIAGKVSDN